MPKRILLIDPIPTNRIRLKAALRSAQYEVVSTDRVSCVKGVLVAHPGLDLILMTTSGIEPGQLLTRLQKAVGPDGPPVICRDDDAGPLRRMQSLATGARDMVSTTVPLTLLLARIRGSLRESETALELERRRFAASTFGFGEAPQEFKASRNVACVKLGSPDFDLASLPFLHAHKAHTLSRAELLLGDEMGTQPDIIFLNVGSDGGDQMAGLLPEIRSRGHLRGASVIVCHPTCAHQIALNALNLGAEDVVGHEASNAEIAHRVGSMLLRKDTRDALRSSSEESFRLAATDSLTGLYNRRYAETYLSDALRSASKGGYGLTLMLLDIDHFKSVNDTHGHTAGDKVLQEVANRIRENLRAMDLVSRHGGEEFLVILPEIEGHEAELAADRLRNEIATSPIKFGDGGKIRVTISVGVAFTPLNWSTGSESEDMSETIADLFQCADEALYLAKNGGRNRVEISPLVAA